MKLNKETKAYKNKLNYISKYNKQNTTRVILALSKNYDKDIIERLEEVEAKATYIKKLIREDIGKQ